MAQRILPKSRLRRLQLKQKRQILINQPRLKHPRFLEERILVLARKTVDGISILDVVDEHFPRCYPHYGAVLLMQGDHIPVPAPPEDVVGSVQGGEFGEEGTGDVGGAEGGGVVSVELVEEDGDGEEGEDEGGGEVLDD